MVQPISNEALYKKFIQLHYLFNTQVTLNMHHGYLLNHRQFYIIGYVDDHVQDLTDLARPALLEHGADPDKVLSEWMKLKTRVYDRYL